MSLGNSSFNVKDRTKREHIFTLIHYKTGVSPFPSLPSIGLSRIVYRSRHKKSKHEYINSMCNKGTNASVRVKIFRMLNRYCGEARIYSTQRTLIRSHDVSEWLPIENSGSGTRQSSDIKQWENLLISNELKPLMSEVVVGFHLTRKNTTICLRVCIFENN